MSERMKSRAWGRTTDVPSYNTFEHVSNKFGRQHTKAPLAVALSPFMSLLYPPNP